MTVKELIEKLQKLPQDADVWIGFGLDANGNVCFVYKITNVVLDKRDGNNVCIQ